MHTCCNMAATAWNMKKKMEKLKKKNYFFYEYFFQIILSALQLENDFIRND